MSRNNTEYEGSGVVKMNPLGPHFYIDAEEGEAPPSDADAMTDMMNHRLSRMDDEHGWPVTHAHIEGHVPITNVTWENGDYFVEDFDVTLDWYSRESLWEWDMP